MTENGSETVDPSISTKPTPGAVQKPAKPAKAQLPEQSPSDDAIQSSSYQPDEVILRAGSRASRAYSLSEFRRSSSSSSDESDDIYRSRRQRRPSIRRSDEVSSRLIEDWRPEPDAPGESNEKIHTSVPDILWRVDVYCKDTTGRKFPTMTFRNDRAYDLSLCELSPASIQQPPQPPEHGQNDPQPTVQNLPVLEVATSVLEQNRSRHAPSHRNSVDQLRIEKSAKNRIIVHSKHLRDALASFLSYYPSYPANEAELRDFYEPYDVLMHHFDNIKNFACGQNQRTDEEKAKSNDTSIDVRQSKLAVEHMKVLYDYLRPLYEGSIKPCLSTLSQSPPMVSFDMLWYLFRPGTDVYVQLDDMVSVCVVRELRSNLDQSEWLSSSTVSQWDIDAWHLVTNGSRIARTQVVHKIRLYTGLREVTSLSICPVSYWDAIDSGARRGQILERSRVYVKALWAKSMLMSYDGPDLTTQRHVCFQDSRYSLFNLLTILVQGKGSSGRTASLDI